MNLAIKSWDFKYHKILLYDTSKNLSLKTKIDSQQLFNDCVCFILAVTPRVENVCISSVLHHSLRLHTP